VHARKDIFHDDFGGSYTFHDSESQHSLFMTQKTHCLNKLVLSYFADFFYCLKIRWASENPRALTAAKTPAYQDGISVDQGPRPTESS
jgi:hypothetical protein